MPKASSSCFLVAGVFWTLSCGTVSIRAQQENSDHQLERAYSPLGQFTNVIITPWLQSNGIYVSVVGQELCRVRQTNSIEICGAQRPIPGALVTLSTPEGIGELDSGQTNPSGETFLAPELPLMGSINPTEMNSVRLEAVDTWLSFDLSEWPPYVDSRSAWLLDIHNSPTFSDLVGFVADYRNHTDVDMVAARHEAEIWRRTESEANSGDPGIVVQAYDDYLNECLLCNHRDETELGRAEAVAEQQSHSEGLAVESDLVAVMAQEIEWLGELDLTGLLGQSLEEVEEACPVGWWRFPDGSGASCESFRGGPHAGFVRVQRGRIDLAAIIMNAGMADPRPLYNEFRLQFSARCQPVPMNIPLASVRNCGEHEFQISATMLSYGSGNSLVSIDVWSESSSRPVNPPPLLQ